MSPNTAVCNYALLRFVPYPERGEGVNVGVLVTCQQPCLLHFKSEKEMPARVFAMFPGQDREMFAAKLEWMRKEVERVRSGIGDPKRCQLAFGELIRPRESTLRFGEAKTILADKPRELVEELFSRYVRMDEAASRELKRAASP